MNGFPYVKAACQLVNVRGGNAPTTSKVYLTNCAVLSTIRAKKENEDQTLCSKCNMNRRKTK